MPDETSVDLFWYYVHKYSRLRFRLTRLVDEARSREEAKYWHRHYNRLWFNIMRFKGVHRHAS